MVLAGPKVRAGASGIFKVASNSRQFPESAVREKTTSWSCRETVCRFREWKRLLRTHNPEIIFVADEGLSINVLMAGIANLLYGRAVVLFYGFENIVQGTEWRKLMRAPTLAAMAVVAKKTLRIAIQEKMLMPLRRRVVHGGLVSYSACADVIHAYNWHPVMRQCWWPVDTETFRRDGEEMQLPWRRGCVVGFVGRFVVEKGVLDLIEAVGLLDCDVNLIFVGDGPARQRMQERIAELGLQERCRLFPPLAAVELAKCYRAMDLLVLPSRTAETWKEQFGRVLAEARCCGIKVAGSNSGAIPSVIGDEDMIFPERDVQALATLIARTLQRKRVDACRDVIGPESFLQEITLLADACIARDTVNA